MTSNPGTPLSQQAHYKLPAGQTHPRDRLAGSLTSKVSQRSRVRGERRPGRRRRGRGGEGHLGFGGGRGVARTTSRLTCGEPGPGGGQTMEASGGSSQACWGRGEVLITSAGRWATSAGTVRCWKRHDTAPCSRPLRAPCVPARARPLPPSRDPPGSAPGRGPRLPGLPRSLPPRPRQQWGPARESGSRGASPASPRPAPGLCRSGRRADLPFPPCPRPRPG